MPASRCVVQECGSVSDPVNGISLHNSPTDKAGDAKWKRFIGFHRDGFKPEGRFVVCSRHFEPSCFQRAMHIPGAKRVLKRGSVPTIWVPEAGEINETIESRKRRQVSLWRAKCMFICCCFFFFSTKELHFCI